MESKRKGKDCNYFKERKGKKRKGKQRNGIEKEKQGEGTQFANMFFPGLPNSILERKAKKRKGKGRKGKESKAMDKERKRKRTGKVCNL